MKQKRDLSMWLKSIKENKISCLYWGYLGLIGIIFYIMNCYTPLHQDDWHYCFIYGTTDPINSIADILKSQYIHYFEMNGRFTPHFIVQFFNGIVGKEIFNLINSIIFITFLHLLVKTIKNDNHLTTLSIIVFLIFFILPGFKYCFLWMSGACNYLWSATFLLYFNLLLDKKIHKIYYPLLFIYGLICGWTHEGIVIGLIFGYIAFFYTHNIRIEKSSTKILLLGLIIGTIFLIFSPGSIHRAIGHGETEMNLTPLIRQYIVALINMHNIRLLPILGTFILLLSIRKRLEKDFIKNNSIGLAAIMTLFIFIVFTKHTSDYSRFGIELFSIIILTKLLLSLKIKKATPILLNTFFLVFSFLYILPTCHENYKEYKRIILKITNNKDGIIITNNKAYLCKRFILNYIPEENGDSYKTFLPNSWTNVTIAKYFHKDKLTFIPEYLITDFNRYPHYFNKFWTNETYPIYVKRIGHDEILKYKNGARPYYILKEILPQSLPFYVRPFYHLFDKYTLKEVIADRTSLIEYKGNTYLLLGKNSLIDKRVQNIILK